MQPINCSWPWRGFIVKQRPRGSDPSTGPVGQENFTTQPERLTPRRTPVFQRGRYPGIDPAQDTKRNATRSCTISTSPKISVLSKACHHTAVRIVSCVFPSPGLGASGPGLHRDRSVREVPGRDVNSHRDECRFSASGICGQGQRDGLVVLAPNIVHLTYFADNNGRPAWRGSLWRLTVTGWRMYFHQDTATS